MKRAPKTLLILVALLCFAGLLKATLPQTVIGKWTSAIGLSQPRANADSVILSNGSILFAGGDVAGVPLQSAEVFGTDGTVSSAGTMNVPRSRHFAAVMSDGRVLVGGGNTTGGGTTNSAEIYDPSTGDWTATSPMNSARANATAALLQDGRVVIAGGDNAGAPSNTIEIYDPSSGNFSVVSGNLSASRTKHAMAVLNNGQVLIIGGFDGTNPLASTDVFDPVAGTIAAGPALATARYSASATTLLNGQVAVIGGAGSDGNGGTTDLASIELFDPTSGTFSTLSATLTTARQGHQAFLLPNNNNVLITGGTTTIGSGTGATEQAIASSELLTGQVSISDGSWTYATSVTGTMNAARAAFSGSANQQNGPTSKVPQTPGLVMVGGGTDASGNTLASTELYAYPTVQTDHSDYAPFTTVTMTGGGFQPGETVTVSLVESPLIDTWGPYTITADANGNISDSSFETDSHDVGIRFYLTAVGSKSGWTAENTFTDAGPAGNGGGTMSISPLSVTAGSTANSLTFTFQGVNGKSFGAGSQVTVALPGGWSSFQTTNSSGPGFVSNFQNASGTSCLPPTPVVSVTSTLIAVTQTCNGNDRFSFKYSNATAQTTAGTATFTTKSSDTSSPPPTLTAISPQPTVAVNAGTAASITATAGTPQSTPAGNAFTTALQATVTDSNSNPVSGATVTFAAPASGTSGKFTNNTNTTTATTNASGVATASTFTANTTTGSYNVTGSVAGVATAANFSLTNTAGAATKFLVSAPANATAGITFSVTVTAQDSSGNTATSYTGTVKFTLGTTDTGAAIPSNYTFTAGDNGTHTFSNAFTLAKAGSQTVIATDTVSSGITGTSGNITVSAGNANKLAFGQQPSNTLAGGPITPAVTVQIQDQFGNPTTSTANVVVTIGTNPGSGTLSGTTTVAAMTGTATFSTLNIDNAGSGYTLSATSGTLAAATSSSFNIDSKIAFTSAPVTEAVGGCSAQVSLQRQNGGGTAASLVSSETVALSANVAGTAFFSDSNCSNALSGSNLSIGANQSSASFFFKNTSATVPPFSIILTGTKNTFVTATATQTESAIPNIAFMNGPSATTVGLCSTTAAKIVATDGTGTTIAPSAPITVNLATTSANGAFYSDNGCSALITTIQIPSGNKGGAMPFYKDKSAGTPTLTATASPASDTVQTTVNKATAVFSNLSGPTINVGATPTTFSGTVNKSGSVVATGNVTVTLTGTTDPISQSAGLDASGNFSASIATDTIPAGTYTIQYAYPGDNNFNHPATNPDVSKSLTVNNPVPTLTSINPTSGNLNTTLDVVLNGTNFLPNVTTVSFGSNITVNTVTVNPLHTQITANITISSSALVGPRNVSVTNPPQGGGIATLSGAFTVNNPATMTSVTTSGTPSTYGTAVTFTATVTSQAGTPTGSVTFYDGGTDCTTHGAALGSAVALNSNGVATLPTSALSATTHTIVVCYTPTGIFQSSSGTVSQTVSAATLTITANDQTKGYGQTLSLGTTAFTTSGLVSPDSVTSVALASAGAATNANAGSYAIVPSGAIGTGLSNYSITYVNGTLTVNQATPTVSFTGAPASAYFGSQFSVSATTNSTAVPTISASGACTISGVVVTITSGSGTCSLQASWPADTNYLAAGPLTQSTNALPEPVTIAVSDVNVTYDGSPHAVTPSSVSPAVAYVVTYTGISPTNYPTSTTAPVNPGKYAVTVTLVDAVDYSYASGNTATLTIQQKDPALVLALHTGTPEPTTYGYRVYFDLTTASGPCPTGQVQFFVDGAAVSTANLPGDCSVLQYATATLTPSAHTAYATYGGDTYYASGQSLTINHTVKADGTNVTLAVDNMTVYVGDQITFTATVTPAYTVDNSATVPSGSVNFYDNDTVNNIQTLIGSAPLNGTTASLSINTLTFGKHSISATYVSDDGLYTGSSSLVDVETVDQITPTINWNTPANIVYGTALTTTQLNANATDPHNGGKSVSGTFTYNPPLNTVLGVGTVTLSATFTPTDAATYATNTASTTITVNPATLTITADDQSRNYGASDPQFTFQYSGFVNSEGTTIVATPPACTTTATPASGVGTHPITCSGAVAPNYTVKYVDGTLTINKAPLTITANDQTKVYGHSVTFAGTEFSTNGIVNNNDSVTSVTLTSDGAAATASAGTYAITPSAAVGPGLTNYTISYQPGKLTVSPAAITVTADPQTKTYGSADPALTYKITGGQLFNGDTLNGALTRVSGENMGKYAIQVGTLAASANYTLTYVGATLCINPAPLNVVADPQTKVYGVADPPLTYKATGFQFTDTVASVVTGALTRASGETVAGTPYAITLGTLAANTNYTIHFTGANLTITPATLTLNVVGGSFTYNAQPFTAPCNVATGLVAPDTVTLTVTYVSGMTPIVAPMNVGAYTATCTSSGNPNYQRATGAAQIMITPATVAITATDQSMTFGGSAPTFTAAYGAFQGSDTNAVVSGLTFTVLDSSNNPVTDFTTLKAGSYSIAPGSATATNYTFQYVNGTLTVNKATFTGTVTTTAADPNTVAYGQPLTATVNLNLYSIGGVPLLQKHADPNDPNKQLPESLTVYLAPVGGNPSQAVKFGTANALPTYDNTNNTSGTTKTGWIATITAAAPTPGNYTAFVYGDDPGDESLSGLNPSLADAGYFYLDTSDINYPILQSTQIDVVQASVTGSFTASDKTYDATTAAIILTRSLTGVVGKDDVSLTGGTATFSDKNVGNGKTVTGTGFTLSGANAANYKLDSSTLTTSASITPATVTGSFTASSKTYDATTAASIANRSLAGVLGGDSVTLYGGTATFSDKNVGTGKTVTGTGFTLQGTDAGNYVLASTTLTTAADITALHITGSFTAGNKTYDATTAATVLTRTVAPIAGDKLWLSGGTATFSDKNVGTSKTVTLTGAMLTGADAGNYILDSVATTTADITALHITGSFTASNKTYDGTTAAYVPTRTLNGAISGDMVSLSAGTATFTDKNVGMGKTVTLTGASLVGADAGNYILDSVGTAMANITALHITGSFTASSKVYDGTTAATVTARSLNGAISGDMVSLYAGTVSFADKNVGTGKTVTLTGATLSGADAGNYVLDSVTTANADITARPLTVTTTAVDKIYDGTTAATVTLSDNRVSGDAFSDSYANAAFADKNVGMGKTVSVTGISISGTDAINYAFNSTAMTTASITPATLTLSVVGNTGTYNAMPFLAACSVASGLFGSDSVLRTITYSSVVVPVNAGSYMATCTSSGNANYQTATGTASIIITPANTTTSLSASPNPSNWTNMVTFTANVVNSSGTNVQPSGSLYFYNAASGATCSSLLASPIIDIGALTGVTDTSVTNYLNTSTAKIYTPSLPPGTDTILACYNYNPPDTSYTTNFVASTPTPPYSQSVVPAPIVTLVNTSLSFGTQAANTKSGIQSVTICNGPSTGICAAATPATYALSISSIALGGNNPGDFTFATLPANNCGGGVLVGGSCTVNIQFAPQSGSSGVESAFLNVTDNNGNVSGSVQSASVSGAGLSTIGPVAGSLSNYAIFATNNRCSAVAISGNGTVDSYNGTTTSAGNVGTNGNATLSGNPVINGAVYSPFGTTGNCSSKGETGLSTSGKAQATGGLQTLAGPVNYPLPPAPSPAPPTTNWNITSCPSGLAGCANAGTKTVTLTPGQYGNLTISGGTTAHVKAGTYNLNSLSLTGNSTLYVDSGPVVGPVVINLAGASLGSIGVAMDSSGGSIVNPSGITSNLQIYFAGSNAIKLSGGSGSYALVYAPNAAISISGGSHFYGSIVSNTLNSSGNTAIHGDLSLATIASGDTLWFSSSGLKVQGLPASGTVKLYVTNASISFTANGTVYNVPVPNAVITFSSTATSASTTWDSANNRWSTLVPTPSVNSNSTIHTFFDGVAFPVPANFPNGIQNVTFQAAYSTTSTGMSFNWQWGAAVYSSLGSNSNLTINALDGTDPAGTPESYKGNLLFGDLGPGYVGMYQGSTSVVPTIAPASIAPSSWNFGSVSKMATGMVTQSFTLSNNQSGLLTMSSTMNPPIVITGTNAADFSWTSNCPDSGATITGGSSCAINITYSVNSTAGVLEKAKVSVYNDAANSPQTVFLQATGAP